jgi:hypothetical protein
VLRRCHDAVSATTTRSAAADALVEERPQRRVVLAGLRVEDDRRALALVEHRAHVARPATGLRVVAFAPRRMRRDPAVEVRREPLDAIAHSRARNRRTAAR